jgi:hypothetical protein
VALIALGLLMLAGAPARAGRPDSRIGAPGARSGSLATAGAPLHTEKVQVGDKTVELGFYMWPIRADQAALLFVQGPIPPRNTVLEVKPAGKNYSSPARVFSHVDQVVPDLSWHEVIVVSRGDWMLELRSGDRVGRLPLRVAGPPEMPAWLAWLIGLSPLLMLACFLRALREVVFADEAERVPWWIDASRRASE